MIAIWHTGNASFLDQPSYYTLSPVCR